MCLLGDGATVRGMPLMNVLVTTPNASSVLDIIDCTDHMEVGGKKDAKYIADIFEEHIEALDPKGVHLNAVLFDGASNVQKAGRLIEAKYPQVSVLHGVEHVISLFFADVSKLNFVLYLIINYRRVYRVFGSGKFRFFDLVFFTFVTNLFSCCFVISISHRFHAWPVCHVSKAS